MSSYECPFCRKTIEMADDVLEVTCPFCFRRSTPSKKRTSKTQENEFEIDREVPRTRKRSIVPLVIIGVLLTVVVGGVILIVRGISKKESQQLGGSATHQDRSQESWAKTGKTATVGDVRVEVTEVSRNNVVGYVFGRGWDMGESSYFTIRIANSSTTKIVRFRGWTDNATLTDEHGNKLLPLNFPVGFEWPGDDRLNASNVPIHPDRSIWIRLCFEPVPTTSTELRLFLPAEALGGEGMIKLRIPLPKGKSRY